MHVSSEVLYTVEPPNKGHFGLVVLSLVEVVPISEVKQYTKVLAWYQQQMSFVERLSLSEGPLWRFQGICIVMHSHKTNMILYTCRKQAHCVNW